MRLQFLETKEGELDLAELEQKAIELVEFIFTLDKGEFYGTIIGRMIISQDLIVRNLTVARFRNAEHKAQRASEYYQKLQNDKEKVYSLVVEVLRFQSW